MSDAITAALPYAIGAALAAPAALIVTSLILLLLRRQTSAPGPSSAAPCF
jgi:hypothetical protein